MAPKGAELAQEGQDNGDPPSRGVSSSPSTDESHEIRKLSSSEAEAARKSAHQGEGSIRNSPEEDIVKVLTENNAQVKTRAISIEDKDEKDVNEMESAEKNESEKTDIQAKERCCESVCLDAAPIYEEVQC